MLSRVAESLYWTARNIERAEDVSRVLHVNFHALLDADLPDHGQAWRELLLLGGRDELFREHFPAYTAHAVTEFLLFHPANPDAVNTCIARARENARGVREQISSEMWEHLNRLHLFVSATRPAAVLAGPHEFLARIRQGSHGFQGVTKATLSRGEAYEFLELGAHLERADATARLLSVKYPALAAVGDDERAAMARLSELLRSCGSFEAFRQAESDRLRSSRVFEYLLLEPRFPRAVLYCLELCLSAIEAISGGSDRPARAVGRIAAELSFVDVPGLHASSTAPLLDRLLRGIDHASNEIAATYFTTRVLLPGPYAQAQQQQQQ